MIDRKAGGEISPVNDTLFRMYWFVVLLCLTLSGCVTKEDDVAQFLAGGGWGVYVVSVCLVRLYDRSYKVNKRVTFLGLVVFIVLSGLGTLQYGEGSLIYWAGDPEHGVKGSFSVPGVLLSGPLLGTILLPPTLLYTLAPLVVFGRLKARIGRDLLPFAVAGLYCLPLALKLGSPAFVYLWGWHILPFAVRQ